MSILLASLPPKERLRVLRARRTAPEQRDARERMLAAKVDELEAVVRALRDILASDGDGDDGEGGEGEADEPARDTQ